MDDPVAAKNSCIPIIATIPIVICSPVAYEPSISILIVAMVLSPGIVGSIVTTRSTVSVNSRIPSGGTPIDARIPPGGLACSG